MASNAATVHLRAKDEGLEKVLREGEKSVQGFGSRITKAFSSIASSIINPFAMIGNVVSSVGGHIQKVTGHLVSFGKESVALYSEQAKSENKLQSVLKATGNAAGFTMGQLKDMASTMQDMTTVGDEVILNSMAITSTFKNVRGDHFKEATMLALDMSRVLDTDLKSSTMQIAKALNDPIKGVTALSEAGVSFTESQREMIRELTETGKGMEAQKIILDELRAEFGGAAAAAVGNFSGKLAQLQNRWGDVKEAIGKAITEVLMPLAPAFDNIMTAIENMLPSLDVVRDTLLSLGATIVEAVEPYFWSFVDTLISAFSLGETIFNNFEESVDVAFKGVRLGLIKLGENVKYFFTSVIPEYLIWLASNWTSVFVDIATYQTTVLNNMWKNFAQFFARAYDWLAGEDNVSYEWHGLTEGFKATLKKLPEIAAREKSTLEKALETELSGALEPLTKDWDTRLAKNKIKVQDLFDKSKSPKLEDIIGEPSGEYDFGYSVKEKKEKEEKEKKEKEKKEKKEDDSFSAGFEDLQSLQKRIQATAASRKDDNVDKEILTEAKKAQDVRTKIAEGITSVLKVFSKMPTDQKELTQRLREFDVSGGIGKAIDVASTSIMDVGKGMLDGVSGLVFDKANEGDNTNKKVLTENEKIRKASEDSLSVLNVIADKISRVGTLI